MIGEGSTKKRKDTKLKKCGSMSGWKISKPMQDQKSCQNPLSLQKITFYRLHCSTKKRWISFCLSLVRSSCSSCTKIKTVNFTPNFNVTEVGRNDIGHYIKNYTNGNDMLKHPERMLMSRFKLENGTVITALFKIQFELGLQCTKFTVLFIILFKNVSTFKILFNQWLMQKNEES